MLRIADGFFMRFLWAMMKQKRIKQHNILNNALKNETKQYIIEINRIDMTEIQVKHT